MPLNRSRQEVPKASAAVKTPLLDVPESSCHFHNIEHLSDIQKTFIQDWLDNDGYICSYNRLEHLINDGRKVEIFQEIKPSMYEDIYSFMKLTVKKHFQHVTKTDKVKINTNDDTQHSVTSSRVIEPEVNETEVSTLSGLGKHLVNAGLKGVNSG